MYKKYTYNFKVYRKLSLNFGISENLFCKIIRNFLCKNEYFILATLKKSKPLNFYIEVKTMFKLSYQSYIPKESVFYEYSKAQANLNTMIQESLILKMIVLTGCLTNITNYKTSEAISS